MKSSRRGLFVCALVIGLFATYDCKAQNSDVNNKDSVFAASETTKPTIDTTEAPTEKNTTTTTAPNTTTPPPDTTTMTSSTTSTTSSTTTTTTTTTTVGPDTTTTTKEPNTTTTSTTTTTPKPTPTPPVTTTTPSPIIPPCRRFDGPSFIGGIVLTLGLLAIGLVAYKFYKARNERNYQTL